MPNRDSTSLSLKKREYKCWLLTRLHGVLQQKNINIGNAVVSGKTNVMSDYRFFLINEKKNLWLMKYLIIKITSIAS